MKKPATLPEKANKILNGVLIVLILVALKVWHLAVVQHDKKLEEASKPQRRTILERSERASIYDRFGIPLATNKVQYNAAVLYAPVRDVPRWSWEEDEAGKRVKCFPRKEYITRLAQKLGEELHLDPRWIEDIIHAKAAVLGNVPCVLKENISEIEYFRLKMMAKDWPGICAEVAAKRCYPLGSVCGEVVGYIGPISRREYDAVTREMGGLREALAAFEEGETHVEGLGTIDQVKGRLAELEKMAYRINDSVGKMGVEASYDETLRGLCGKHIYLSDIRGNFLRELPGSTERVPGSRLVLTLSSELQSYAQELLAEYDSEPLSATPAAVKRRELIPENQPWIKGGAIVALDPRTGEVYAMASFPTFDPNDFIRTDHDPEGAAKSRNVLKWLETEDYLSKVWDMKTPYTRERFDGEWYEDCIEMGWEAYLGFILPRKSAIRETLDKRHSIADAIEVQSKVERLVGLMQNPSRSLTTAQIFDFLYKGPEHTATKAMVTIPEKEGLALRYEQVKTQVESAKQDLAPYFAKLPQNYEKLLLADLYRLAVDAARFNPFLIDVLGQMSISEYRDVSARFSSVSDAIRKVSRDIFVENDFKTWREEHFTAYLEQKRLEEKEANKKYARPYIEYLEMVQDDLFEAFWKEHQWELIALFLAGGKAPQNPAMAPYTSALTNWVKELGSGAHQGLDWVYHYHRLRSTTDELNYTILVPFLRTLRSFDQLNRPLLGVYSGLHGGKERDLAAAFYPTYGLGFARSHAFRQAATIGSIFKLVPAYEALRQKYVAQQTQGAGLGSLNPLVIIDDKHRSGARGEGWNVGYGLDGKAIPMFYHGGRLPRSEHAGVGRVDLVKALETSSNPYFAMLAGDLLSDPEDLCEAAHMFGFGEKTGIELPGEYAGRLPSDVAYNRTGLYSMSIGQHTLVGTPLQTAMMLASVANGGAIFKPQVVKAQISGKVVRLTHSEVRRQVYMPSQIQELLLTGMRQVIRGEKGTARSLRSHYDAQLLNQIIGKTSTAEAIERMSLDGTNGRLKLKHVWFGAIAYESDDFTKPELVVVVYLRYGEWGKDAAPLAVEMVKKWRAIKQKHLKPSA